MLKRDQAVKGTKLLVKSAAVDTPDGVPQNRNPISMIVGTSGKKAGREVQLVSGDVLVVEGAPRKVGGLYTCRVRRAISQSVGMVSWDLLRKSSSVLT